MTPDTARTIAQFLFDGDHFNAEAHFMQFLPGTEGWLTDKFAEWVWQQIVAELDALYHQEATRELQELARTTEVGQ